MKHPLSQLTLGLFLMISILLNQQVSGECLRCKKIEEDRAKEQAKNPQRVGYYDDLVGFFTGSKRQTRHRPTNPSMDESQNIADQEADDQSIIPDRTYRSQNGQRSEGQINSVMFTILNTKNFLNAIEDGPFTLFIPANEALQRLPAGKLQSLFNPANREQLATLVSNHVVAQEILREDFTKGKQIKTLGGHSLTLGSSNGVLTINGARVLQVEPIGNNGIVYIIDQVLSP